jgi:hypothetical protein
MADDSLIDEMRAAIRGDRERAEQRQAQLRFSPAEPPSPLPPALPEEDTHPALHTDPAAAPRRAAWPRWLRRGRHH